MTVALVISKMDSFSLTIIAFFSITIGVTLLFDHFKHEWDNSYQRKQEEHDKFRKAMKEMEIDEDSIKAAIKKFHSTDEMAEANKVLRKFIKDENDGCTQRV